MQIIQLDSQTFVGSQISLDDITEQNFRNINTIIITRPEDEELDQPTFASIKLIGNGIGIKVYQIPVISGQITEEDVQAFEALTNKEGGPVFIYCRSGHRAASLWALNKAKKGLLTEEILYIAKNAGYDLAALGPKIAANVSQRI
ncbi:TIGR01244 family sulfur transferase [Alphaproteobacteria bacterium]|nr:TIGR01244 family sulfur transferase [Alphaproteobacteria bacterium]